MSAPSLEPVSASECLNATESYTDQRRQPKPSEAFSVALAKSDRYVSRHNAVPPDNALANVPPAELASMTLDELAHAAARKDSSFRSYEAKAEIARRVAQAQIDAAIAQRDAAHAQKLKAQAARAFIPAALLGIIIGWLVAKLSGIA